MCNKIMLKNEIKCPQRERENENIKFEELFSQSFFRKTLKEKVPVWVF